MRRLLRGKGEPGRGRDSHAEERRSGGFGTGESKTRGNQGIWKGFARRGAEERRGGTSRDIDVRGLSDGMRANKD